MTKLYEQKCQACEGFGSAMDPESAQKHLKEIPGWTLHESGKSIFKKYSFKSFYPTMGFVNAIAFIAQAEGHHPDLEVGYNYCNISFTTHALGGLSINDFICAAKINKLLS